MSRKMNVEKMQEAVDKLVKEAGLSDEDYEEMLATAEEDILKMGTVPEDMVEYYTLKKLQLALKLRFSSSSSEMEGFFFGQHPVFDFAAKPHELVEGYVDKMGKMKANELGICDSTMVPLVYHVDRNTGEPVALDYNSDIDSDKYEEAGPLEQDEMEDMIFKLGQREAIKHGYMNDKGEPLYVNDQYREGQVIPAHDWSRVAYALIKAPGEEDAKIGIVNIRGDEALNGVPLFEFGKFSGRVNQRKSGPNHLEMSMKNAFVSTGEEVNFEDFEDILQGLIPERMLEGLDELEGFINARKKEFKRWCIAPMVDIMEIGAPAPSGVVPITITDYSMTSFKSNSAELTFWIEQDMLSGLQENALDTVVVLAPYIKKDGTISGNCIGYWVDPKFRTEAPEILSEDEVLDSW